MNLVVGAILIFLARVTDVSMGTIRTLMVVRGKRGYAALIGFFEVMIYIIALSRVVNTLDAPLNLVVYALGFAAGTYLGSFIEEKMALGIISVQIISSKAEEMTSTLRDEGFGVTEIEGQGKEGSRKLLIISSRRKLLPRLLELAEDIDDKSFITVMDARTTRRGYFAQRKGK